MKKILISVFLLGATSIFAANENTQKDLEGWFSYEKGFDLSRKIAPSCPYKKCTEPVKQNPKIYFEKKTGFYFQKKPKYSAILPLLFQEIDKGSVYSSDKYIKFYVKNMNFKERNKSKLKKKEEEKKKIYGVDNKISLKEYFKKSVNISFNNNSCLGTYYSGVLSQKGLMGINVNKPEAKKIFQTASKICKSEKKIYRKIIINLSKLRKY